MPKGKGTYGKRRGRPKKRRNGKNKRTRKKNSKYTKWLKLQIEKRSLKQV